MVIECTACHTRFKLADDKLKPGGTKVRCSKCKQIFTVMPPEPAPAPAPPSPPVREEEIDFGEFNMERLAGQAEEAAAPPPVESAEAAFGGKEEAAGPSEFAFEEEEEKPGEPSFGPEEFAFDEKEEAAGPSEFAFEEEEEKPGESPFGPEEFTSGGKEEAAGPSEFDFGEETEAQPGEPSLGPEEFAFGEKEEATGPGEFDFEEEEREEFSFETGEEPGAPEGFGFEEGEAKESAEFSFEEEESALDTGTTFSWEPEESGKGGDEFGFDEGEAPAGEAEEFDFSGITFGEEETAPAAPVEQERVPQARVQPAVSETETLRLQPEAPAPETAAAPRREPAPVPLPPAPRRKSPVRVVMLLMILLLAVIAGAVYFYWQGTIPELSSLVDRLTGQTTPPPVSGQIRLEGLTSLYVTNQEAGQLLVIQGQAVNDYPQTRSSIAVKGVLFNKAGKALLQQTVFCGNPLDQQALKSLPFAKIEESMNNPFGESLSNLNVAPGKAIPFTIVFRNLPPDIAEFTVEAADSKPGTKQ